MVDKQAITRDALRNRTAPSLLCERARSIPDRVAFRSKHLGIYRERSFRDYALLVARAARALAGIGLTKGERVAIMGDACEEWMICDLASQSLGAIVYGIYPTASAAEVEYQLRDGGAVIFIAEDQEYVDKILPIIDRLPDMRAVIVIDDSAMFAYDHPKLVSYEKLVGPADSDLDWLEAQVGQVHARDPAIIVYTSGTTGHPKGALITHGKHLAATVNLVDHYPTLAEKQHRTVAYLPLCHILGRDIAVTLPLISRLVPHFGEDPEDLATTMFEVAPTVLFTVPRYLQKFAAQIVVGIANSSTLKRTSYEFAMRLARRHVRKCFGMAPRPERTRQPTAPVMRRYFARFSTSSASIAWSLSSAVARHCRPRRWRFGTCTVSTFWRFTAKRKKRAASLRDNADSFRGRAMSVPPRTAGTCALPTMAKSWCAAPICSKAIGATRTQRAPSNTRTAGCAPATSANGRTVHYASSTARAISS